jgi:hypothetical protein
LGVPIVALAPHHEHVGSTYAAQLKTLGKA